MLVKVQLRRDVGQQAAHIAHWHFHIREQGHLFGVAHQSRQVQHQRAVVFHTRFGKAFSRGREGIIHILVFLVSQFAHLPIHHQIGINLRRHITAAKLTPRGLNRVGGNLVKVVAEYLKMRLLGFRLTLFQ